MVAQRTDDAIAVGIVKQDVEFLLVVNAETFERNNDESPEVAETENDPLPGARRSAWDRDVTKERRVLHK
jgi:hypothetical protein